MNNHIKNIVFDLGGVLLNLNFNKAMQAFKKAGLADIEDQINAFESVFAQFEKGNISPATFRNAIREKAHVALTDNEIDDLWNLMLLDIPHEKLKLILDLRSRYMVYLLSNTNAIHWDYICKNAFDYHRFRVNDYFEDTFLSFKMHLAKPDKSIYERMLQEANLLPEETLFIDDSEANCKAAEELGIQTHHYQTGENLSKLFE